ncbi:hypothetical protein EGT67_12795 [Prescottella agglutinans]|uniref:Uncharacterized protein n=2 Tax=Prescottella agglutinans TaxID=1644129 RepID=A0A438BDF0_9NOCA|nr:hypothetical protein EGT67_12795 [Prescottella agglutinans]
MRTMEIDDSTRQSDSEDTGSPATVVTLGRFRRRPGRVTAVISAACVAVSVLVFAASYDKMGVPEQSQVVTVGAAFTLEQTATLVAATTEPIATGPIRHLQFANLTDAGHPTYDTFVRPDGTALVGRVGEGLHETSGYLTSAQLADLPVDPDQLRSQMLTLSHQLGLGYADEAPDRALYRLATKLLPDPAVTPDVKSGIYRVLAGLDLEAIRARDLGIGTDRTGRPGYVLEFTFEEGYVDRMVIDTGTGALISVETLDREGKVFGGQVNVFAEMVDHMP